MQPSIILLDVQHVVELLVSAFLIFCRSPGLVSLSTVPQIAIYQHFHVEPTGRTSTLVTVITHFTLHVAHFIHSF